MSEVLTVNGVGFGWSVDFGLQDWLVPGGVWMHQGSMVSALADIAGSVGGYLQPHDTDSVMRVLPLWPMEWWRWPQELVPQIELPEGFSEIDETEVLDLPEYNRIFRARRGRWCVRGSDPAGHGGRRAQAAHGGASLDYHH